MPDNYKVADANATPELRARVTDDNIAALWRRSSGFDERIIALQASVASLSSTLNSLSVSVSAAPAISFSVTPPLSVLASVVSLDYTTNFQLTGTDLDTIQGIRPTDSPTFAGLTLTGLNGIVYGNAGVLAGLGAAANGQIPIGAGAAAPVLGTITPTANQTTITNGAGTITVGTVQDINVGSSPTFAGLTINGNITLTPTSWIGTGAGGTRLQWNAVGGEIQCHATWDMQGYDIEDAGNIHAVYGNIYVERNNTHPLLVLDYKNVDNNFDPQIWFEENSVNIWSVGMDTGNSNRFVITPTAAGVGGQTDFNMDTDSNIGVGIAASANHKLWVYNTRSDATIFSGLFDVYGTLTANGNYRWYGLAGHAYSNGGAFNNAGQLYGLQFTANHVAAGTLSEVYGIYVGYGSYNLSGVPGNITSWSRGLYIVPQVAAGSTVYGLMDIWIAAPTGGGTITNDYCIYSAHDAPSRIVGHWSIFADNRYVKWGAAEDCGIMFNGTNMVLDSALVAASDINITCGANKTVELQNVVYDDINSGSQTISLLGLFLGPSATDLLDNTGTGTGISIYGFGVGEAFSNCFEIEHRYAEGQDIIFHLHWAGQASAPTGTDKVQWQLTYSICKTGSTTPPPTTITIEADIDTRYEWHTTSFAAISGVGVEIGDQFLFTLERIAATTDEYASDAVVATVGIHAPMNTIGSRQIIAK